MPKLPKSLTRLLNTSRPTQGMTHEQLMDYDLSNQMERNRYKFKVRSQGSGSTSSLQLKDRQSIGTDPDTAVATTHRPLREKEEV